MDWNTMRDGLLGNADATADLGARLILMAKQIEAESWQFADLLVDGGNDDPPIGALLKRNIYATELLAAGLKDLRKAVLRGSAASSA